MEKMTGEGYSYFEQIQYTNDWHLDAYLQGLYERLQLAKEMLAVNGIIVMRMDIHHGHHLKLIADEVFGRDMFQNEVAVNRVKKNVTKKGKRTIPHAIDHLYIYFSGSDAEFLDIHRQLPQMKPGYWHNMESAGVPGPRSLTFEGKIYYPSPGSHFKFTQPQADSMWALSKIRVNPSTQNLEYWVEDRDEENLDSNWTDIPGYTFTTGYPTENAEALLERVLQCCSKPTELVMDFYSGSGTTVAVAQRLGRRWIACDINKGSVQTTSKRLQTIIKGQVAAMSRSRQTKLVKGESEAPEPMQFSFTIWRVNDYDLQIQRDEAVNLACEHIGIDRSHTDSFFDGTLGRSLVKLIPFNHPLSLLDLEEVRRELDARPEEDRNITLVCLGKELTADAWIEDWNRLRKGDRAVNRLIVIELRSDPKYGKFIEYKPATAKVSIARENGEIKITIEDFISPSIIERLQQQSGILQTRIDDWRSMVDCVMIDPAYDGAVFNVALSDVPKKKDDFVAGAYSIPAPEIQTTVAVKIIDMLGEEVLIINQI